jgi:hypothetical protein
MATLQEWIHRLEVGSGAKYVRVGLAVLGFWVWRCSITWWNIGIFPLRKEWMPAQVARQISRGEGFTTRFVRPLSVALVERHQMSRSDRSSDFALLREDHP